MQFKWLMACKKTIKVVKVLFRDSNIQIESAGRKPKKTTSLYVFHNKTISIDFLERTLHHIVLKIKVQAKFLKVILD